MSEWELPANVETTSIESGGGFIWESGVYDTTIKLNLILSIVKSIPYT